MLEGKSSCSLFRATASKARKAVRISKLDFDASDATKGANGVAKWIASLRIRSSENRGDGYLRFNEKIKKTYAGGILEDELKATSYRRPSDLTMDFRVWSCSRLMRDLLYLTGFASLISEGLGRSKSNVGPHKQQELFLPRVPSNFVPSASWIHLNLFERPNPLNSMNRR